MNVQVYRNISRLFTYVDCLELKGQALIYDTEDDLCFWTVLQQDREHSGHHLN